MLEIDGIEYRVSDLRGIGAQAEKEHPKPIDPKTEIGKAGLCYGHLLDPRVAILLDSRKRYRFRSWTELSQILNKWWRYDPQDEHSQAIPAALEQYYVPFRRDPYKLTDEMYLDDLLEQWRKHTGTHSDLIEVRKANTNWDYAANSPNRKLRESALQALWGVCGNAAQSLVDRLAALGGRPVRTFHRDFEGAEDARLLEAFLKLRVRETMLIQICEPSAHQFTIEKRPDHTAYLHQGYISAYSALWWAGAPGAERDPYFTATGTIAKELIKVRNTYGLGKAIPLDEFASALCTYLLADVHGPESVAAWRRLPFNPGQIEDDDRRAGRTVTIKLKDEEPPEPKPIILKVEVIQLADEKAVRKELDDGGKNEPLTTLVMRESARWIPEPDSGSSKPKSGNPT